jgi:phage repressor protein C with HTH and peptisase S24 domain
MRKLADIFREKRLERGLSQEDFSLFLGLSKAYVGNVERNRFVPGLRVLKVFAKKNGISYEKLENMHWEEKKEINKKNKIFEFEENRPIPSNGGIQGEETGKSISVPVIALGRAGSEGFFTDQGYPAGTGFDYVNVSEDTTKGDENAYAIRIEGDSMLPCREGWIVVCSPNKQVSNNDLVIAKTREDEVLFKQIKFHKDTIILSSHNTAYEDLYFSKEDFYFYHKVVGIKIR